MKETLNMLNILTAGVIITLALCAISTFLIFTPCHKIGMYGYAATLFCLALTVFGVLKFETEDN